MIAADQKTRFSAGPLIAQTLLVATLMLAALMAPPASGAMLLVPLGPTRGGPVVQQALSDGARLEGAGLIPGSFVVHAQRDRIAPDMWRAGVLVLAAYPLLCGKAGQAPL